MANKSKMSETANLFLNSLKGKNEGQPSSPAEEKKQDAPAEAQEEAKAQARPAAEKPEKPKGGRKKLYGEKPKKYSLNLDEKLFERACAYCDEEGISFNHLVNRSLKRELEKLGR